VDTKTSFAQTSTIGPQKIERFGISMRSQAFGEATLSMYPKEEIMREFHEINNDQTGILNRDAFMSKRADEGKSCLENFKDTVVESVMNIDKKIKTKLIAFRKDENDEMGRMSEAEQNARMRRGVWDVTKSKLPWQKLPEKTGKQKNLIDTRKHMGLTDDLFIENDARDLNLEIETGNFQEFYQDELANEDMFDSDYEDSSVDQEDIFGLPEPDFFESLDLNL
jgi:rRNA maturation endonuclease Nob1